MNLCCSRHPDHQDAPQEVFAGAETKPMGSLLHCLCCIHHHPVNAFNAMNGGLRAIMLRE